MSHTDSAVYSPYGAYELKSRYQRNFLYGTGITLAFVLVLLATFWLIRVLGEEEIAAGPVHIIKTVAELGPPPAIAKKPPQVKVNQPNVVAPKVGIPTPVADDEVLDDDVTLATRDELAQIITEPVNIAESDGDIVVDIQDEDYLPSIDEFVAVEITAEPIYREEPVYPRLARQAGLEGVVWVKALVTKDGTVKEAVVYKTSDVPSFDQAAVEAAYKWRFKPAIQNGRPVAMWVAFQLGFEMEN